MELVLGLLTVLLFVFIFLYIIITIPIFLFYCLSIPVGLFYLIDTAFLDDSRVLGTVKSKLFNPDEKRYIPVGPHQKKYKLLIKVPKGDAWIFVSKSTYNSVFIGSEVYVRYCLGRLTKSLYLNSIMD